MASSRMLYFPLCGMWWVYQLQGVSTSSVSMSFRIHHRRLRMMQRFESGGRHSIAWWCSSGHAHRTCMLTVPGGSGYGMCSASCSFVWKYTCFDADYVSTA